MKKDNSNLEKKERVVLEKYLKLKEIERKNKIYVKARLIFLIGIFYSDPQLYLLKISSLLRGCLS